MSTIGIDFGTSFCSASWVNPITQKPESIIFNETGTVKIPSVIFFPESGEPQVGLGPYQQIESCGGFTEEQQIPILKNTIQSIKRKMRPKGVFRVNGREYSHVEIVAFILKKVKQQAEMSCKFQEPVGKLILTHPVVFEEWKKEMLREAALNAGFDEVTLLEEPVSAAIGYIRANQLEDAQGILVYDFGGGTFDIAYVRICEDGSYKLPLPTRGLASCGGDDIDMALYMEWEQRSQKEYHRSICLNKGELDLGFLSRCRKHKELLSNMPHALLSEMLPYMPGHELERIQMDVNRQDFNRIIHDVVQQTMEQTAMVVQDIKAHEMPLDFVLLIGGSSRLPLVSEGLRKLMPSIKICTTGAVDTAVALGATYYHMDSLSQHRQKRGVPGFCIYCGNPLTSLDRQCPSCGKDNYIYMSQHESH